jgi:hypothetical protein
MQIKPTNKTVGDLMNFYGSIMNEFYPRFFIPQPRSARKTNTSISGGEYVLCPNRSDTTQLVPTTMVVYYINNMTGMKPQAENMCVL